MSKNGSMAYQASQIKVTDKWTVPTVLSDRSQKSYLNHAIKFADWCKETYGCVVLEECGVHIQAYADYLKAKEMSPSTIHTYIAGICRYWGVKMETITGRPKRTVASNQRSRGVKASDTRADTKREASPRLYDFQVCVGARRMEVHRIKGNDYVIDESGHPCVRILRGKGGKYQEQRILPEDISFIERYFDGSENYVFTKNEMKNKIDLHHLRAMLAQRAYIYYLNQLQADPSYRKQLTMEIKARWELHNTKKAWSEARVKGQYYIRGENRNFAMQNGLPLGYDNLAVMAVSVFHLSHWRLDVTIANYLLAI